MDQQDAVRKLESLAQLDTDAVATYAEALQHVTDDEVRKSFEAFQGEHRYHAQRLGELIVTLGGEKPELKVDTAGHLADWVTALRSRSGTEGALHAMETAEHYHNRRYAEAVGWDIGDEVVANQVHGFFEDEKRHLEFIEARLGKTVQTGDRG